MFSNDEINEIIEKSAESAKKRESRKIALAKVQIPADSLRIGGKARKRARVSRDTYDSHVFREYGGILPNLPARNNQESTVSALNYKRTPDAELQSSAKARIHDTNLTLYPPERLRIREKTPRIRLNFNIP